MISDDCNSGRIASHENLTWKPSGKTQILGPLSQQRQPATICMTMTAR